MLLDKKRWNPNDGHKKYNRRHTTCNKITTRNKHKHRHIKQ